MINNMHEKMPVLFVGHGSPMNAIGENPARSSWKAEGERLGKPRSIVAVSAHWMTRGLFVRRSAGNPQINDMYGFPRELYEVHYEPAGSVDLATHVLELLGAGAAENNDWGIDHGVWSVLSNMYPEADVPVVIVSTDVTADPETQFETGRKLRQLREEGALLVASGNVVHNLRLLSWESEEGYPWADRFDNTIRDSILRGDFELPVHFQTLPDSSKAAPTVEHFYPLLVALGAAEPGEAVRVWNDYREKGSMSMTSYTFGG